jgi:cytochrome P450
MNRVAHQPVQLSDGTLIPKGASLGIPVTALTDEKYHQDPLKFDGHRFYNLRQQPGNETKYQFVTTSNEHISFGHGKHACPGRFFASNEIKIALVQMLLTYDFRFPPSKGKPKCLENGTSMVPDPRGQIQYRRKQELATSLSI